MDAEDHPAAPTVPISRRRLLRVGLRAGVIGIATPAFGQPAPRVVFLNPGEAVERGTGPLWRTVSRFMAVAAHALGLGLEVLYAERDHLLMTRQARELARRVPAPDYVVIVNEKLAAPSLMQALAGCAAKVFLIHNDLTPEQRKQHGNEREGFANWIGTAVPDNARGGHLLMAELYRQLGHGDEPRILGITGDPATPVSAERAEGVAGYVAGARRGRVDQLAHGDWSYADGEQKARVLLARYPRTNLIWTANDSMALGALRTVRALGAAVRVGGMGGWPDALESIASGGLAATAAGHYLIGAWAMVMLHDYHLGRDFARHGGAAQKLDFLYVVNRERVSRYDRALFQDADALDFRATSRVLHPRPGPYDFQLAPLARALRAP